MVGQYPFLVFVIQVKARTVRRNIRVTHHLSLLRVSLVIILRVPHPWRLSVLGKLQQLVPFVQKLPAALIRFLEN